MVVGIMSALALCVILERLSRLLARVPQDARLDVI